jgi:hypothetical protein
VDVYVQESGFKAFGTERRREGQSHRTFADAALIAHYDYLVLHFRHILFYARHGFVYSDLVHEELLS